MSKPKGTPLTRGVFLKTAAAGAGFTVLPHIVPASALGREGNIAAGNRITIDAIGAGWMGTGKAIIATARKFLEIIYQTLKNDWIFEDFSNFVTANT